jgi:hypothetical protein
VIALARFVVEFVVDSNYSFETYVRSPSKQEIFLSIPSQWYMIFVMAKLTKTAQPISEADLAGACLIPSSVSTMT